MQRVLWNEWTEQQYISSARLSELSKCPLAAEWPSGLLLVSWIAAQQYLLEHAVQTHFPLAALALLMLWKSFKSSLLCKAGRTSTSFPLMRACVCALCQILPVYCSVCFLFLFFMVVTVCGLILWNKEEMVVCGLFCIDLCLRIIKPMCFH